MADCCLLVVGCRLLGHRRTGEIQFYASVILSQRARLHHGALCYVCSVHCALYTVLRLQCAASVRTVSLCAAVSAVCHCAQVFDVGRKSTYKSLGNWYRPAVITFVEINSYPWTKSCELIVLHRYKELRNFCPKIPVIVCANKVDLNYEVPLFYCMFSASCSTLLSRLCLAGSYKPTGAHLFFDGRVRVE